MDPLIHANERLVSFSDVKQLYIQTYKSLYKWAILGGTLFFLYFGHLELKYKAIATFQEAVEKNISENIFKELIIGISSSTQPQTSSVMMSHQVLRPLTKKLGLQIQEKGREGFLAKWFRLYQENWRAEKAKLIQDINPFTFSDVQYEEEIPFSFKIQFVTDRDYKVLRKGIILAMGMVGEPCHVKKLTFTISKAPENLKIQKIYSFEVNHWLKVVTELQKKIKIKSDKDNKSILVISINDRDRVLAVNVVNELMLQYESFVKREYDAIAKMQIAYLEQKQAQIFEKMDQLLNEHVAYLNANLKHDGIVDLEEQAEILFSPYHEMHRKLFSIEMELKRLEHDIALEDKDAFVQKMHDLKREKDLIGLNLIEHDKELASLQFLPEEKREAVDLALARNLFAQYHKKLDEVESLFTHYKKIKNELKNPHFNLSTLGSILNDPLSQKIIAEASALELKMRDDKHHSVRESERWKEEIFLQKEILGSHLDQLMDVQELDAALIRNKIVDLQRLSLDCIDQELLVLNDQIVDRVKNRKKTLLVEKEVLKKQMEEIREKISSIMPEKWRLEKWLEIKKTMLAKVMETVIKVVESKTMTSHLHHVESKPLDFATLPILPLKPYLFFMTSLGGVLLPLFMFSLSLIQRFLRGFPATEEKLKNLHFPYLGRVSALCDGPPTEAPTGPDLELLRKMALFAKEGKVISLLGGNGPDYSSFFAENLARRGEYALLIRLDFHAKADLKTSPGILQIWEGKIGELPIRKGRSFDTITSGGFTSFGTEIIQSSCFSDLLEEVKTKYDRVFLVCRGPLTSVESESALKLSDKAIVTVSGEKIEELTPFIHWGYDRDNSRITFITSS